MAGLNSRTVRRTGQGLMLLGAVVAAGILVFDVVSDRSEWSGHPLSSAIVTLLSLPMGLLWFAALGALPGGILVYVADLIEAKERGVTQEMLRILRRQEK